MGIEKSLETARNKDRMKEKEKLNVLQERNA